MRFGKESIKWALIVSEHIGAEEIGDELDYVYAQALKADECEAKAKAWDKLNEYVSATPYDGIDMDTLKNRLNNFMDESGEYDAEK